ncbi:hypothetical protein GCM10011499_07920 [Pelagibacterium lentulum]|uniref:DUF3800 domain-containing protein n=2 Tax=Pelagibacterium lentulum TaxID=2029865 RepID=A0A916VVJ8_9HYPH|nr:hypothetical protein GCM10011499_07920 [Pelagibacterium lentulum]
MRQYRNQRAEKAGAKQWFYNWMVRILIERVSDYCLRRAERYELERRHVKFVFSQSGGHSYSQTAAYHELLKYQAENSNLVLTKWSPKREVLHWGLVEDFPHHMRAGLQLADVAASAFYMGADKLDTGPCAPEYAMALRDRIAMNRFGTQCDYGVVLQPDKDWKIDITEDQRQVFRFYGYDFIERW